MNDLTHVAYLALAGCTALALAMTALAALTMSGMFWWALLKTALAYWLS